MKAMESSENHPIEGDVEVDETVFGGQEENTKGRKNINKKLGTGYREEEQRRALRKSNPQRQCRTIGRFYESPYRPQSKNHYRLKACIIYFHGLVFKN
jgi:hypothetical protein